ncbi:hypothetical protein GPECTOR_13g792 [Gonium pectorale]|uniref:Uncharacterized protein n=1 Tax=Gonium pectorale TaxID=33097 RepID=A0A150GNF5_GONPE|nr:hypothetical protein GPECTOR_13g792 [Gonium pectorale]|eukprot:KXZ51305.1 hypothetical protein GPECTOR_13g792 [Gonium pectorale]
MLHVLRSSMEPPVAGSALPPAWATAAPLASLPLLLLPPAAAKEVQRLHEEVLGAEAVACLDGLLSQQAGGGGGEAQQALLAAAAADVASSGLYDMAYDLGTLLSTPHSAPAGLIIERTVEAQPVLSDEDSRVMGGLLRLLAVRGMDACVGELLRAVEAGGGECPPELVPYDGGGEPGHGGAAAGAATEPAADTSVQRRLTSPAWWLRALFRGFQPPALEAAYQDFKAAQLVGLDRVTLLLSPYLQARVTAFGLVPMMLLSRHDAQGSWLPGLLFAAGLTTVSMTISASTDLRMRLRFLRGQRRDASDETHCWGAGGEPPGEEGFSSSVSSAASAAKSGGADVEVESF